MQISLLILPGLISGIITIFLAFKIYVENPKKMQNRIFVLLMIGFFILCICVFLINLSKDVDYVLSIGSIYYLAAIYLPVIFFHFTYLFPKQSIRKRHIYFLGSQYLLCIGLYLYFMYHSSIDDVYTSDLGNYVYFNGKTFIIGFYLIILLILAICNLFQRYLKETSPIEKQQIRHVFFGGLIAIIIVVIHIVLLFFKIKTFFMIPIAITIFSIFIAAAILKFNLFIYKPMSEIMLAKEKIVLLNRDELEKEVEARTTALIGINENLEKEVLERRKAEEQLTKSLREKEVLLKEIHHRVKNNLQIISSLIYLQNRKIQDPKINELLNEVNNRIRSMSLIHENIYKSENFDTIDLHAYVRAIIRELVSVYKIDENNVTLTISIQNVFVDINTAILCGLIINELVTNAIKYAFPQQRKGEIVVEAISYSNQFSLVIRDNGIGIPKDIDIKNTKTLGLQLVNTLVKQLNGKLDITIKDGTEFRISCPKDEDHTRRDDTDKHIDS
ncbi:MAG: histidine kinase dimerization/phosphoacceptor domain -containing protein [Thermoplasmatota archaeon]